MKNSDSLKVTPSGDREIVITRLFDAPRGLVFDGVDQAGADPAMALGPRGLVDDGVHRGSPSRRGLPVRVAQRSERSGDGVGGYLSRGRAPRAHRAHRAVRSARLPRGIRDYDRVDGKGRPDHLHGQDPVRLEDGARHRPVLRHGAGRGGKLQQAGAGLGGPGPDNVNSNPSTSGGSSWIRGSDYLCIPSKTSLERRRCTASFWAQSPTLRGPTMWVLESETKR